VEISWTETGDFFWASAVHHLEAGLEAQKKWPMLVYHPPHRSTTRAAPPGSPVLYSLRRRVGRITYITSDLKRRHRD
jgi:hypothetical protein